MYGKEEKTQDHCIEYEVTYPLHTRDADILYSDIYSEDTLKQTAATKLFSTLFQRREDASASTTGPSSCPGALDIATIV